MKLAPELKVVGAAAVVEDEAPEAEAAAAVEDEAPEAVVVVDEVAAEAAEAAEADVVLTKPPATRLPRSKPISPDCSVHPCGGVPGCFRTDGVFQIVNG